MVKKYTAIALFITMLAVNTNYAPRIRNYAHSTSVVQFKDDNPNANDLEANDANSSDSSSNHVGPTTTISRVTRIITSRVHSMARTFSTMVGANRSINTSNDSSDTAIASTTCNSFDVSFNKIFCEYLVDYMGDPTGYDRIVIGLIVIVKIVAVVAESAVTTASDLATNDNVNTNRKAALNHVDIAKASVKRIQDIAQSIESDTEDIEYRYTAIMFAEDFGELFKIMLEKDIARLQAVNIPKFLAVSTLFNQIIQTVCLITSVKIEDLKKCTKKSLNGYAIAANTNACYTCQGAHCLRGGRNGDMIINPASTNLHSDKGFIGYFGWWRTWRYTLAIAKPYSFEL
jgi:hypothetical protein